MSIDIANSDSLGMPLVPIVTPDDLARRFGDIPLSRIRFSPRPGEATEQDVLAIDNHEDRLCELVDGTLIEKVMGSYESLIAVNLLTELGHYLKSNRVGIALGPDGMLRLRLKLIRIPDVSFISKENLRSGKFPRHGIAAVAPTIAVEVISEGNTRREMQEKLSEYFQYGAVEVWYLYPDSKTLVRHTAANQSHELNQNDTLTTPLLPGFSCPIGPLFVHPDDEFGNVDLTE